MISRAVVDSINDTKKMQLAKLRVLAGEVKDKIEVFQNFGFTSNPPVGSEAVVAFMSGNREHGIVLACGDRRIRFKGLAPGEAAVYTDDGTVIHLKKSGNIEVQASAKVLVTCPEAEFTGDLKVGGNLQVDGDAEVTGALDVGGKISGGENVEATALVQGAGFTGPAGGPVVSSSNIQTSGDVQGGGTSLSAVKSAFNGHTHTETGVTTGGPSTSV